MSPRIQVVDQRTALENQILGTWRELDQQMQLLQSVRGDGQPPEAEAPAVRLRRQAIAARQLLVYLRDEVDEHLQAGCLGEDNRGRLAERPCDRPPSGATPAGQLAARVNQARATIIDFILAASPELTERDRPPLQKAWVLLLRERLAPGHWYQDDDGTWRRRE